MCKVMQELLDNEREIGIEEGMEKGLEKGLAEGHSKGLTEGRFSIVLNMLKNGMSEADIIRLCSCTSEELQKAKAALTVN